MPDPSPSPLTPSELSALDFVMDRIGLTFTVTGDTRFDDRTIAAARAELLALREENERLRAALADTDHTARCKFRQHFDDAPCSCGKSVIERARALASFDAAALRMSDPGAFVPAPPTQEAPAG